MKTSWWYLCKTSWRRLEEAFKRSWRRFKDVLKTSSKRLEDVLKAHGQDKWTNVLVLTKTSWRRLEDVFWRRKAKANIFVLIKTSSEDEDKRRVHQDECLLGSNTIATTHYRITCLHSINNCYYIFVFYHFFHLLCNSKAIKINYYCHSHMYLSFSASFEISNVVCFAQSKACVPDPNVFYE